MESNPINWTIEYVLEHAEECQTYLGRAENFGSIPLLNNINNSVVPNLSLVRYRGMIQDMLDPEFYLQKYSMMGAAGTRMQDGRFRDTIVYQDETESLVTESEDNVHGERRSMFVLSVPGINSWVPELELELYADRYAGLSQNNSGVCSVLSKTKRKAEADEELDVDAQVNFSFDPTDPVKKMKTLSTECVKSVRSANQTYISVDYLVNSPIPERPSQACIVKLYKDWDVYKLNTLVDVIGFISMDPVLDGSQDQPSEFDGIDIEEHLSTNPPPSLIPRLHAVCIRELMHINPLLDRATESAHYVKTDIHRDLLKVLTQCLFGDELAAHYLLCHLLSCIYARVDIENLGRCTLNISNIPAGVVGGDYIRQLYEILSLLLPASHYFPLTLDNLNTTQFNPIKDFKTNRLTSGLLQLAQHTHLVLDETQLATGQLQAPGLAGITSLTQLIQSQSVKFDFQFYQLDFDADIPVLILSEGKSLLPSDFHCPLRPSDCQSVALIGETLRAAKHFVLSKAKEMRCFITSQKIAKFTLGPSLQGVIENDLVELRRDFSLKPDDFHLLLNLSRLTGKSLGKFEADTETWEMVKSLEMERRHRVESLPQRNLVNVPEA